MATAYFFGGGGGWETPHRHAFGRDRPPGRAGTEAPGPDSGLCRPGTEGAAARSSCRRSSAGRRKDILFFTQELSTLLNAGVPLDRALSITAELTEHANFRSLVLDIVRLLKGGKSLADSLATHPAVFFRSVREHGARG